MDLLRQDLEAIRNAALQAVDPAAAVRRFLRRKGKQLFIGKDVIWPLGKSDIALVAIGKAAAPMASAALKILGPYVPKGVVVTKYGHAAGVELPRGLRVIEAGHPVPDEASVRAGATVLGWACAVGASGAPLLLLLSGGASALLANSMRDVSLADLQATTTALLRAGASVNELNTVRKHLSVLQGGRLAALTAPTPLAALILSDVVGDPLDVIASGPTVPDPTTYADALTVLRRYDLLASIPATVRQLLEDGVRGEMPETPKPGAPAFVQVHNYIIGSNRMAALAALAEAKRRGYRGLLLSTFVEGEAREVAKVAAALVKSVQTHGDPLPAPACLVWGGETTVTVRGTGRGGRNQELALAAALALEGREQVALMALATDGSDGPTDAAGAVVDGTTAARARALGRDPWAALVANDAYPLLAATGDLLRIGPTGTNVNDLWVALVGQPEAAARSSKNAL